MLGNTLNHGFCTMFSNNLLLLTCLRKVLHINLFSNMHTDRLPCPKQIKFISITVSALKACGPWGLAWEKKVCVCTDTLLLLGLEDRDKPAIQSCTIGSYFRTVTESRNLFLPLEECCECPWQTGVVLCAHSRLKRTYFTSKATEGKELMEKKELSSLLTPLLVYSWYWIS